jgi:hypothetical protein
MLRAARRTSPLPPQVVQRLGWVPGRAPLPAHAAQRSSVFSLTVFFTPVATSVSESLTVTRVLPAARVLSPPAPPKMDSNPPEPPPRVRC